MKNKDVNDKENGDRRSQIKETMVKCMMKSGLRVKTNFKTISRILGDSS